jgi:isopenicillin-N N-acyltransferase-like protein
MLEVTLEGTSYEMGYQHGAADPERVRDNIRKFNASGRFSDKLGFHQGVIEGEKRLQKWHPGLIEEMRGIADGAGLAYQDILIHNLYSFLGSFTTAYASREGCSCAGFAKTPYGPLVGKNNDAGGGIETHLLAKCYPQDKASFIHITYIGMVGSVAGMNQHGFTLGGASVPAGTPGDATDCLFMFWVIRKWLEECSTVAEAVESARHIRITSSCSHLIADLTDSKDSFVHMEYFQPNYVFIRYPEDNRLFFTNHPVTEEGRRLALDISTPEAVANSHARFQVLEELTGEAPRTPEGLQSIMSAHSSPVRICQHYGIEGAVMSTDASLVFVPQERVLHISRGRPCEVGYDTVRL